MRWVSGASVGAQQVPGVPSIYRSAPMPDPSLAASAARARPLQRATASELITPDEASTLLHWTVARPIRVRASTHAGRADDDDELLVAYVYAPRLVRPGECTSDTLGDDFWATYERLRRLDLGIAVARDTGAQAPTQTQVQEEAQQAQQVLLRVSNATQPVGGAAPPQKAASAQMLQQQRLSGIREEDLYDAETDPETDYDWSGSVASLDNAVQRHSNHLRLKQVQADARSESKSANKQLASLGGKPKKSSRIRRALSGFARLARFGRRSSDAGTSASTTELNEHQSRKQKLKGLAPAREANGSDSLNGHARRSTRSIGSVVARVGSLESLHSYDSDKTARTRRALTAAPQLFVEAPTPEHKPKSIASSQNQQVCIN